MVTIEREKKNAFFITQSFKTDIRTRHCTNMDMYDNIILANYKTHHVRFWTKGDNFLPSVNPKFIPINPKINPRVESLNIFKITNNDC